MQVRRSVSITESKKLRTKCGIFIALSHALHACEQHKLTGKK